MTRKDPYKYFRIEARELSEALSQGVLELEKTGTSKELVARLLRHAHTLKGASRVVRLTDVAELAHAVEDTLAPFREGTISIPRDGVDGLLKLVDTLTAKLATLDSSATETPRMESQTATPPPRMDTVRLEVGEVDTVLERLSEAATGLTLLRKETAGLDSIRRLAHRLAEQRNGDMAPRLRSVAEEVLSGLERFHRLANVTLDQTERELFQAHERAGRLRLLQAGSLFDFLERAVRDAARALGKKVRFEAVGGGQRLDAPVLTALQDALLHVVRNAVAHGLENPGTRAASGKSSEGVIRLEVERRGGHVSFRCHDDGQGIDRDAIRRSAVAKGLLPASSPNPLSLEDAVKLLLSGGISTSNAVTEVSGRGVGLDVVRETVERLHGEVFITSESGRGTTVELRVPYSLSTFAALAVVADGVPALIPFDGVRRAVRVTESEVARTPEGDTVLFEQNAVPFFPLNGIFSRSAEKNRGPRPAVVVQSGSGLAVVAVDKIMGVQETVARPMPALSTFNEIVAGASLDVEGNPCLVLDPDGLVHAARARTGAAAAQESTRRPVILVVDDSLTTRMLEQSILESAGYEVETAVSAEEGLIKARQKSYGLFLVDVEMPGMNGFQLLEMFRGDSALRDIPAILVTSRSSPEDKRRGEAVGARDYIVKGEFDQARLLTRIRGFIG